MSLHCTGCDGDSGRREFLRQVAGILAGVAGSLRIGPAGAVVQLGGVDRDGVLHLLEQVLVVHDVAKILVLTV